MKRGRRGLVVRTGVRAGRKGGYQRVSHPGPGFDPRIRYPFHWDMYQR